MLLSLAACQPDYIDVPVTKKQIASNLQIEYMYFKSQDTFFLCGGIRAEKGEIFRSTDAGLHWQSVYEGPDKLNCLYFKNEQQAYAAGDSVHIERSFDGGQTWAQTVNIEYLKPWRNELSSITRMWFWDGIGAVAISNDNREFGNAYYTWDEGNEWASVRNNNGLRDWWIFHNDSIYAVGYGMIQKIEYQHVDGYKGYKPIVTPLAFDGDYFTGIWFTSDNVGYLSGYNGGIYKTVDGGKSWTTLYKKNHLFQKRVHFNDILFTNENVGYVIGENGLCMKTFNAGKSWSLIKMNTQNTLLGLFYYNGIVYITSVDGQYFEIKD